MESEWKWTEIQSVFSSHVITHRCRSLGLSRGFSLLSFFQQTLSFVSSIGAVWHLAHQPDHSNALTVYFKLGERGTCWQSFCLFYSSCCCLFFFFLSFFVIFPSFIVSFLFSFSHYYCSSSCHSFFSQSSFLPLYTPLSLLPVCWMEQVLDRYNNLCTTQD